CIHSVSRTRNPHTMPAPKLNSQRSTQEKSDQLFLRNDHAIIVSVNIITRRNRHTTKADLKIHLPFPATHRLDRHTAQRHHAKVQLRQLIHVTTGTVDDDPGPAILHRTLSDHVANQRITQAAATIDHQHLALTRCTQQLLDARVVLEAFHRHRLATKYLATTVTEPVQPGYNRILAFVCITQIAGHKIHVLPHLFV